MKKEPPNNRDPFIGDYIHVVRGTRVMLDETLAALYGVPMKRLNEQVRRNRSRFPGDFMFQLSTEETAILRSQFATSSLWGSRRSSPLAFTEQGIVMLSGVLKSPRAIQVNIHIMRAFVAMRKYAITHDALARRIDEPEGKYDERFAVVFEVLKRLFEEPPPDEKRKIAFLSEERAPYLVFN